MPPDHLLGARPLEGLVRQETRGANPTSFALDNQQNELLRFSNEIKLEDDLTLIEIQWGEILAPCLSNRNPQTTSPRTTGDG